MKPCNALTSPASPPDFPGALTERLFRQVIKSRCRKRCPILLVEVKIAEPTHWWRPRFNASGAKPILASGSRKMMPR